MARGRVRSREWSCLLIARYVARTLRYTRVIRKDSNAINDNFRDNPKAARCDDNCTLKKTPLRGTIVTRTKKCYRYMV